MQLSVATTILTTRGTWEDKDSETGFLFSQARLLASITAASLNLVVIVTLNKVTKGMKGPYDHTY